MDNLFQLLIHHDIKSSHLLQLDNNLILICVPNIDNI